MASRAGLAIIPFEDDDISGDEFDLGEERQAKQLELVREIASGRLEIDFEKQEDMAEFKEKYESCLTGEGTLIHVVLDSCRDDNFDRFKPLLKFMISKYPILLETSNKQAETTLHYAIRKRLGRVTEYLCRNSEESAAARAISCRGPLRGNCLHAAIRQRLNVDVICYLISICEAESLNGENNDGSVPLHLAVGLTRPRKTRENPQQPSRRRSLGPNDDNADQTLASDIRAKDQGSHVTPSQLVPQAGVQASQYLSLQTLLPVVKALVEKDPSGLSHRNGRTLLTPYQERLQQLRKANIAKYFEETPISDSKTDSDLENERELEFRELVIGDPIAAFIREYCIKYFGRGEAMASLYQPGQERQIEFDLSTLPHTAISQEYLDRLSKLLKFETMLQYVALPQLTIEPAVGTKRKDRDQRPVMRSRSDLVAVFDWLRNSGVKKIIKVIVIDDTKPFHSDSSIEAALKGFEVEVWDWNKPDLSTEVIGNSTKCVREISLYSTGNNAVLLGWVSPHGGLLDKVMFPMLQIVKLFVQEGLEDRARLEHYIETFRIRIKEGTSNRVRIDDIIVKDGVNYASKIRSSEGDIQAKTSWFDCVAMFSRLLSRAPKAQGMNRVKIAIIDDGVDASLETLDGKIASGTSFCTDPHSLDLMSPYFISASGHGTCMAALIGRICPDASLYVAKLDQRPDGGSEKQRVTAGSAAEAILWAIKCKVHIICMGWTIEASATDNLELMELKDAIKMAASECILMFCSTSDEGAIFAGHCYPCDYTDSIVIGAATETGELLSFVHSENVDFLLPGHKVPFPEIEGESVSYVTSSSVATAAASGLAGLLLLCSWLVDGDDSSLRERHHMLRAFEAMSLKNKFIHVQPFLEHRFKGALAQAKDTEPREERPAAYNLATLKWDEDVMSALRSLMRSIRRDRF